MLKNCTLIILLVLFYSTNSSGQSVEAFKRAAQTALAEKNYFAATKFYATILKKRPRDMNARWGLAECFRLQSSFPEAERQYLKIQDNHSNASSQIQELDLRLGEVRQNQGKYASAIEAYEKFLAAHPNSGFVRQAEQNIEHCRWAVEQMKPMTAARVKHLGRAANSPYSDFAPYLVNDTLIFSSYRFDEKRKGKVTGRKITRLAQSIRGGRSRELTRGWPITDTAHIAHTALTTDGHFMFFTVCKNSNYVDIRCELWLAVKGRNNRWEWQFRLPEPINLPGYTTTQPSVGFDSTYRGHMLWFASDRPGGKSGLDIWSVPLDSVYFCPCILPLQNKKMPPPGPFLVPTPVSEVNTEGDDITPFFHNDSQTLYFASNGWPGYGGFDIFSVPYRQGKVSGKPQNGGEGLNTSYNDLYPFIGKNGLTGYLSSNRPGAFYLDETNKACCLDLFSFERDKPIPIIPDTVDTPSLVIKSPPPTVTVPIEIPPVTLKTFIGLPLYFDNDEPDKRTVRKTTAKTYGETAEVYLERQDEYRQRFSEGLPENRKFIAEAQIDSLFDDQIRQGYERLQELCALLVQRLEKGDSIVVLIKGFTSPRAKSDYNINLGHRRVSSVVNHIAAYNDGILRPYLNNKTLRVEETSFGETTARKGISDALADERNSIYHPDAARERRVEIIEIHSQTNQKKF